MPRCYHCEERAILGLRDWLETSEGFKDTGPIKNGCAMHANFSIHLLDGRVLPVDEFLREWMSIPRDKPITLEIMKAAEKHEDIRVRHVADFILNMGKAKTAPVISNSADELRSGTASSN